MWHVIGAFWFDWSHMDGWVCSKIVFLGVRDQCLHGQFGVEKDAFVLIRAVILRAVKCMRD